MTSVAAATYGPDEGEVVLLVSGLSRQRIEWPAALPTALHAAGLRTITVDTIADPDRVRSLTSIMSITGSPAAGRADR